MQFLLSFKGRISRSQYWLHFYLPFILLYLVAIFVDVIVGTYSKSDSIGLFSGVLALLSIWPSLAIGAKRCHDRDHSGWWLLLYLIPIIGPIWLLVELGFLRGTAGANRFGSDPVAA